MQIPLTRGRSDAQRFTSGLTRRIGAASLQGLAASVALFALLSSSACIGLSTKPLEPGGTGAGTSSSTGGAKGSLSATPGTIAFGSVVVGTMNSATVTLSNTSDVSDTVTRVASSGYGFIYYGLPTPITIGPGLSMSFSVAFQPVGAGASSGSMTVVTSTASYKVTLTG